MCTEIVTIYMDLLSLKPIKFWFTLAHSPFIIKHSYKWSNFMTPWVYFVTYHLYILFQETLTLLCLFIPLFLVIMVWQGLAVCGWFGPWDEFISISVPATCVTMVSVLATVFVNHVSLEWDIRYVLQNVTLSDLARTCLSCGATDKHPSFWGEGERVRFIMGAAGRLARTTSGLLL